MRIADRTLVAILIATCGGVVFADDHWDYPNAGRRGVNEVSAGRGGQLRVFDCETTDPVEEVVLLYAKRMGMKSDHRLVIAASKGFSQLENDLHVDYGFGHDTDKKKDHTQVVANVTSHHAHVTFLHRPDLQRRVYTALSISQTPAGASVHVIQLKGDVAVKRPIRTQTGWCPHSLHDTTGTGPRPAGGGREAGRPSRGTSARKRSHMGDSVMYRAHAAVSPLSRSTY